MKRVFLFLILMAVTSSITTKAQSITGKVVDETASPLAYANVILQKGDSTYIAGAVADTAGRFAIAAHPEAAWVQVTFIGYETQYRALNDIELIKLTPDTEVLGKAVVKAVIPKTEIHGDALVTKIENSVLAKSGSATDVLERLPGARYPDSGRICVSKSDYFVLVSKIRSKHRETMADIAL